MTEKWDAPERIHAYWKLGVYQYWDDEERKEFASIEYVRADIAQAMQAQLEMICDERDARIDELHENLQNMIFYFADDAIYDADEYEIVSRARAALAKTEPEAKLQAERESIADKLSTWNLDDEDGVHLLMDEVISYLKFGRQIELRKAKEGNQ